MKLKNKKLYAIININHGGKFHAYMVSFYSNENVIGYFVTMNPDAFAINICASEKDAVAMVNGFNQGYKENGNYYE